MKKQNKGFTLVELIVVITILAILATIAFISFQGYSGDAKNAKRLSDVKNIYKKIQVEQLKGKGMNELVNVTSTGALTINGGLGTRNQGVINFNELGENRDKFTDNGIDYPVSYSVGGTGTGGYKFTQIATINDTTAKGIVVGNYYKMDSGDSESIITNEAGQFVTNDGDVLPYIAVSGGSSSSTSSGGPVAVNGICGSDDGGNFTSNPTNLCSAGNASSVTDNGGGNTYTWTCDGINGGTTDSCSANNTSLSQYPGCNEPDITVGSYTIAACNVGATTASTDWTVSRGSYFQWGRNKGFAYGDTSQQSTQIAGSIGLNASTDITNFVWSSGLTNGDWSNTDTTNNWGHTTNTSVARQGPCAPGYHVPSQAEWQGIVTAGGWGINGASMQSALKLPYAGFRYWYYGTWINGGSTGNYWSSTPNGAFGYYLHFSSSNINPSISSNRANGFSIRCFKN